MNRSRIEWIDTVKGVAILTVMLGHIDWGENPLCIWIYSFHMPVWFFLSGVLAYHSRGASSPPLSRFAVGKAESLLYPYFTFSLISIAYVTASLGFGKETALLLLAMISLLGISGAMWFLPVMFFSSVLFESLRRCRIHSGLIAAILPVLIYFGDRYTPFEYYYAVQRVMISLSFIFLGYAFEMLTDKMPDRKNMKLITGLVMLTCGMLLSRTNGLVDLHYGTMNNMFRYYALAMLGCVGLCLTGESLSLPGWLKAPLIYWGRNSLIILATHVNLPFISKSRSVFSLLLGPNGTGRRYLDDLIILLILLVFETVAIALINRFCKFLLHPKYLIKMNESR